MHIILYIKGLFTAIIEHGHVAEAYFILKHLANEAIERTPLSNTSKLGDPCVI